MTKSHLVYKLKARVEVVEEIGGAVIFDTKIVEGKLSAYLKDIVVSLSYTKTVHTTKAHRRAREQYLSVILLCAADRSRSRGRFLQELKNGSLKRQSKFPETLTKALAMLNNCYALALTHSALCGYEGVAFVQKEKGVTFAQKGGKEVPAGITLSQKVGNRKAKDKIGLILYRYYNKGHFSYE